MGIMFEKETSGIAAPTEELTTLEKNTAYGTTVTTFSDSEFRVQLSALKSKTIAVNREGGIWVARTKIGSHENKKLLAVHVEMAKTWVPSVAYIELFGEDGSHEVIEKAAGTGAAARKRAFDQQQLREKQAATISP